MPVSVARLGPGALVLLALALSAAPAPAPAAAPGVTWAERIEVAAGGGYQGPWRMNASVFEYVDDPTVAINDRGVVGVAWADQAEQDIFVQIYEPDGTERFEEPVNVSGSPGIFSWLPRLLIGAGEGREVYLLWQEIVFSGGSHGGEIFFARSTDGGMSFSAPRNLSNTIAGAGKGRLTPRHWHNGSLDLARGPDGHLYAAWTEYEGGLWFSRSTDHGASFAAPVRLAGGSDAKPARGPALAVAAEGAVYLAWTVGDDPTADIHIARSADGGRSFDMPRPVTAGAGHADAPKLAVDGGGTVHLVYAQSPAGPFERYHVRYTRSDDGGRTFADPREIAGPHAERFASVAFPALSVDRAGHLYVLWELFPRRGERPQGLGFAWSSDGGQTFAAPEIVPGSVDPALGANGGRQGLLMRKLAVNGAGAIAVVNSTFRSNEGSHVWLFRGQRVAG
jgi:hypothetical protein